MNWAEKVASLFRSKQQVTLNPIGKVKVVDPNPLNWLYITYNTVEELIRADQDGATQPAAMQSYRWINHRTLEIRVRRGDRFPHGETVTPAAVKRAFDEMFRWRTPHPPGSQFNLDPKTTLEISGPNTVRLRLPQPDGFALGKLRAMHIMSSRFWNELGFGYERLGTGEGLW